MTDFLSPIPIEIGGVVEFPYGRIQHLTVNTENQNEPPFIKFSVRNYRVENGLKIDAPLETLRQFEVSGGEVTLKFIALYELNGTNGNALIEAVRDGLLKLVQVL